MNADARIEVVRPWLMEFNEYGRGGRQIILWEHNLACNVPADWTTSPCGVWDYGLWLDANGVIVIPERAVNTKTWHDPERTAFRWWAERGWHIDQGGVWQK